METSISRSGEDNYPVVRMASTRFRFLSLLLSIILMAAAVLKGLESAVRSDFIAGPLSNHWLQLAEMEGELCWAAFLAIGCFPSTMWRVTFLGFSIFACVAFYKAYAGDVSCGCFGRSSVNPWVTGTFDCGVLVALRLCRPEISTARVIKQSMTWQRTLLALIVVLLGTIVTVAAVAYKPVTQGNNGVVDADSHIVVLEPEKLVGNYFSLAGQIDVGPQLKQGRWIVVMYHADCETCRKAIPVYKEFNARVRDREGGIDIKICFVEMPPYAAPRDDPLHGFAGEDSSSRHISSGTTSIRGKLSEKHEWFATTPIVVELSDGLILKAASGEAATNLAWLK
jgi:hypothetical protein